MAALVVDASVALAWALPDEISDYAEAALAALENGILHVPEIWPREIANGLALALRRGRITAGQEQYFISEMHRLTIEVENTAPLTVIREGTAAAGRFGLTAYDAAYVDLALRTSLPLATLDRAMRSAAVKVGVVMFES